MKNCKWTAGPWSINTDRNGTWIDSESESFPVCMIDGDSDRLSDQDKTNANLIAAAPELYDMLQAALPLIKSNSMDDTATEFDQWMYDETQRALAKARGEQK